MGTTGPAASTSFANGKVTSLPSTIVGTLWSKSVIGGSGYLELRWLESAPHHRQPSLGAPPLVSTSLCAAVTALSIRGPIMGAGLAGTLSAGNSLLTRDPLSLHGQQVVSTSFAEGTTARCIINGGTARRGRRGIPRRHAYGVAPAASPSTGVVDVFARGSDGAVWQRAYNHGWSS